MKTTTPPGAARRRAGGAPGRLLFVITTSDVGGSESFLANLALGIDRERFAPAVCSLCPVGRAGERIAAGGIPVTSLGMSPGARPVELAAGVVRLARLIDRQRIDLVQALLYRANMMCALAGRLARRRVAVVTGQRSLSAMTGRLAALGVRWTRRLADTTVAVSEAVKAQIVGAEGLDPGRVAVIANGVDAERFRPADAAAARRRLELDGAALIVGGVGRLAESKGFEHLIEALTAVAPRLPRLELVLVGDGPGRQALEQLARRRGISDRVHLLGRRGDLERIYPAFDVFVLSSLREGSPNVLIEAMACGVAAVATDVGGVKEVFTGGDCGLMVPAADPAALAAAVERLAGDPALRRRLAAAARARVELELTIEKMVEKHEAVYGELLTS